MKLEEVTKTKRWYDDACGTALAMELVGERWALLIARELMFGPRRFGELRAGLPGISANVLTQRLAGLERAGIVVRRQLPPPVPVQAYALTPWGLESEAAIRELGRWAARSPQHDPTLPLSGASLMLSFRTMFSRDRAAGLGATVGFRFGADGFVATVDGDWIHIRRDDPASADIVFDSDPMTMAAIVYGGQPFADAEAAGQLRIAGNRALAERFVTLFPLPSKVVVE
jgi:DNA-binding HxlR family transcriptional regulator